MQKNDPNEGNRIWAAHQLASESYYIDPSEPNKVYTNDEVLAANNLGSSYTGVVGFSAIEEEINKGKVTNKTLEPSQTDLSSMLALRQLFANYELHENTSGMDATMRTILKIQSNSGIKPDEYNFSSKDRTTKVSIKTVQTFTLDDIHEFHRNDDKIEFMADCIPGVGTVLSPLYSQARELEQDGEMTLYNTSKNIALGVIGAKNSKVGLVASGADTSYSLLQDKKDTYNRDGITLKEGDTFILVETRTNQGLDVSNVRVYVRNNEIFSYQQFGPYGGYGHYGGYESMIKYRWKREGYK